MSTAHPGSRDRGEELYSVQPSISDTLLPGTRPGSPSKGSGMVPRSPAAPRCRRGHHPPSERSVVPISKGMTSSGKTPLSPTMSEPRREQIHVSSLSPLSRAPQDSLSLLSRRQAAAAPRLRRACWEPPAPPRSSRARAARKRSLCPAMPGQGHPGMPRAERHTKAAYVSGHPWPCTCLEDMAPGPSPRSRRPQRPPSCPPPPGPPRTPVRGA